MIAIDRSLLPVEIRRLPDDAQGRYLLGLQFEQQLIEQMTARQVTESASPVSTSDLIARCILEAGGLGLAAQLAREES